jgi:transcriptional regulator with XRE-family HTH domain
MLTKRMHRGRADHRDAEIGRRVRAQRLVRGLSQTELGTKIGVSFQQLQKYENGGNRIGAGCLERIAEALKVPVSFFFPEDSAASLAPAHQQDSPFALLSTTGAIHLVRAYARIQDGPARRALVEVAEYLADVVGRPVRQSRKA